MQTLSRAERRQALFAVVDELLLSNEFDVLSINIERPMRELVGTRTHPTIYEDTGVRTIIITGLMPIQERTYGVVKSEDVTQEDLDWVREEEYAENDDEQP
jgi:hypothetical protein